MTRGMIRKGIRRPGRKSILGNGGREGGLLLARGEVRLGWGWVHGGMTGMEGWGFSESPFFPSHGEIVR